VCLLLRPLAGAKYYNQFVHNVHNVLNLHWPSLLAGRWSDRHQTCTRWSTGKPASRVCSRSRSKVTWYRHFCAGTNIASWGLLGYVELFIIRVKFAIYYFLHFNKVRQVAARLRAKSAIYDCLVLFLVRVSGQRHLRSWPKKLNHSCYSHWTVNMAVCIHQI